MKKWILFLLCTQVTSAQTVPVDRLYLGQTPPGATPKIFQVPVGSGLFPAERVAISQDNTEIYYSELNGYPPSTARVKYFKYSGNTWNGPFSIFEHYYSPALSSDGKTIFVENNQLKSYYAARTDSIWGSLEEFWTKPHDQHYLQLTKSGKYYLKSDRVFTTNGDISQLMIQGTDTTVQSLGIPINSTNNGADYFISRDESYSIFVVKSNGLGNLFISYHKPGGGWTNPKSLGGLINAANAWEWGPYVTDDNKYLFFTRQTSSINIFWVRADNLIDSLKHTNFTPYLSTQIPNQTDTVNHPFSLRIPDSTFIDDDGNNTLSYSAALSSGTALPAWLTFSPDARTFSGTPNAAGTINVAVTARDTAGASVSCIFPIRIIIDTGVKDMNNLLPEEIRLDPNYPNPFNPTTVIGYQLPLFSRVRLTIYNVLGEKIKILQNGFQQAGKYSVFWDATDDKNLPVSSGMYIYRLETNEKTLQKKMLLIK
jgi:hypothetical protein